jgi:hypothetical protein
VNRRLTILAGAFALMTLGALAESQNAEAGRYRFSGGGSRYSRGGGVSVHYSRPSYGGYRGYSYGRGWGVRGSIYVGPSRGYGYYPRYYYPYPRYYYYYNPVPSYYGVYSYSQPYYPVAPQASVVSAPGTVAVVARPELPKFGIGLFAGGSSVENTNGGSSNESQDIGLLGRFRLTNGLLIEGEFGKTEYANDLRIDRRLGAALIYEIGAYNKLAPYVLAGLGVQQAEVGDGQFQTRQNFGELGIGLRYALTPRFHLTFDVRAGSRATAESEAVPNPDVATRQISPPTVDSTANENYTRARFAAIYNF